MPDYAEPIIAAPRHDTARYQVASAPKVLKPAFELAARFLQQSRSPAHAFQCWSSAIFSHVEGARRPAAYLGGRFGCVRMEDLSDRVIFFGSGILATKRFTRSLKSARDRPCARPVIISRAIVASRYEPKRKTTPSGIEDGYETLFYEALRRKYFRLFRK